MFGTKAAFGKSLQTLLRMREEDPDLGGNGKTLQDKQRSGRVRGNNSQLAADRVRTLIVINNAPSASIIQPETNTIVKKKQTYRLRRKARSR